MTAAATLPLSAIGEERYVYAVVRDGTGVDPPLRTVSAHRLAAVVSPLSAEMIAARDLAQTGRETATSLDALWQAVRAHEAVVEQLLERMDVVPMRFGTVAASSQAVRHMLTHNRAAICGALDRIAGKTEWSVRFLPLPDGPSSPTSVAQDDTSPGRSYLHARRAAEMRRADFWSVSTERVSRVAAELAEAAADWRPSTSATRSSRRHHVDAAAYLVERDSQDRFLSHLETLLAREGPDSLHAEVTGPWPAYNFVADRDWEPC